MKKFLLISGALLGGALAMQAFDSPYKGTEPVAEGEYYLYNVETGLWIDANSDYPDQWTSKAIAKNIGRLFQAKVDEGTTVDDGIELYGWYWNCGSINKAWNAFLMDCSIDDGRTTTYFVPTPVESDNENVGYTLKFDNGDGTFKFFVAENPGTNSCSFLVPSDDAANGTWQFVTREERLAKMVADAVNNADGVDATWLVNGYNMSEHDCRLDNWCGWQGTDKSGIGGYGNGWRAMEYWNTGEIDRWLVIQGLPAGTYEYTVEGYNRDGNVWASKNVNGPFENTGWYYINADGHQLKNLFDEARDSQQDGFNGSIEGVDNVFFPTSLADAAYAFHNGCYQNRPVSAVIGDDGQIVLGLCKFRLIAEDSYVIGRMSLKYKASTDAADYTEQKAWIDGIIAAANEAVEKGAPIAGMSDKIAELQGLKEKIGENTFSTVCRVAYALRAMTDQAYASVNLIDIYNKTKALIPEGTDISKAEQFFADAASVDDYNNAVNWLRTIRRRAAARRVDDRFEGSAPFPEGDFYLYNVGQRQFYDAGGDWSVHPILDIPGVKFKAQDAEGSSCLMYNYNTTGRQTLAGWLSLDGNDNHKWTFVPVEGQTNTFFFTDENGALGYIDQPVNNNSTYCETNMWLHAEGDYDHADKNFWWKIVTPEELAEAVPAATVGAPVDVTFLIDNPGFNMFFPMDSWNLIGDANVYGGASPWHSIQSGNIPEMEVSQEIAADKLPSGVYEVECQGLYRHGDHWAQGTADAESHMSLMAGTDLALLTEHNSVRLPNIIDEANKAPGEGGSIVTNDAGDHLEYPENQDQCGRFYRTGLYKRSLLIKFDASEGAPLTIGLASDENSVPSGSYVNADNFRMKYYGPATQKIDGKDVNVLDYLKNGVSTGIGTAVTEAPAAADSRVYNLQGIRVANPAVPGIYIRDGKKFIVR